MKKPWYKDGELLFANFLIFLSIGMLMTVVSLVIVNIVSRRDYSMIMDDQGIERKCIVTTMNYYRDVYTDENGNVVLTIDRVRE